MAEEEAQRNQDQALAQDTLMIGLLQLFRSF
jgi:hypothetical protein